MLERVLNFMIVAFLGVIICLQPLGPDEFYFMNEAWQIANHGKQPIDTYPFPLYPSLMGAFIKAFENQFLVFLVIKLFLLGLLLLIYIRISNGSNGLGLYLLTALFILLISRRGLDLRPESIAVISALTSIFLLSYFKLWAGAHRNLLLYAFIGLQLVVGSASPRFMIFVIFSLVVVYRLYCRGNLRPYLTAIVISSLLYMLIYSNLVSHVYDNVTHFLTHPDMDLRQNATIEYKLSRIFGPRYLFPYLLALLFFLFYRDISSLGRKVFDIFVLYVSCAVFYTLFVITYDRVPYEYVSLPLICSAILAFVARYVRIGSQKV